MRRSGPEARRVTVRLVAALAVVVTGFLAAPAPPVGAHTEIDFTVPTDGAAVGEPVAEVTVGFTQPVTLIGSGFEVLDPQGTVRTLFVATDDDQVFRLQLDPPLAGGEAAVRYEVRAQDGHTIAGGFSFAISVEAGTATTVVPASVAPQPTTEPGTAEPTATATSTAAATPATDAATITVPDVEPTDEEPTDAEPADDEGSSGVYLAIAAAVVIGAAVFLFIRSRATTAG